MSRVSLVRTFIYLLYIIPAHEMPPGRVRGYRDDGQQRAVRAEVQLPAPHVPGHGVPLGHRRAQGRYDVST